MVSTGAADNHSTDVHRLLRPDVRSSSIYEKEGGWGTTVEDGS